MPNKRLIEAVPDIKKMMMKKTLFNWISLIFGIMFYVCLAMLLGEVLKQGEKTNMLIYFSIAIVAVIIRFYIIKRTSEISHIIASNVKLILREKIYAKLRNLGSGYSENFKTSEVTQLATEGVEQLELYFANYLPQLYYALLAPMTLFLIYAPLSLKTAIALFVCVPLIPVSIVAVQKIAKNLLGKYWGKYTDLGDTFLENLQGLTTLKVYSADEKKHVQMNKEAENFRKITMRVLIMQLNSITVMDIVAYGGTAIGTILCVNELVNGNISVPEAIFMILLAAEFFLSMRTLGSFFHIAMNGIAASERMFRLFDLEVKSNDKIAQDADINIAELNFSYGEKQVLFDINAGIKRGSFVSVVGENGSGKSTLAKILNKNINSYTGNVLLGKAELKDISNINEIVTTVSLGSYIFKGNIRETLKLGDENASDKQMEEVLKKVNLYEFIRDNGGLDMKLNERGSNLSGGQRQRLALARALLKNSPLYIFDEATSNIDTDSENMILEVILKLKQSHTVIMITHRLKNVIDSDEILFINKGRIEERGTHEELLKLDRGYSTLYVKQKELEGIVA